MVILNDAVRRLIDAPNLAVLASINADGSPQTSVVWVGRDGDDLLISSADGRRKVRNLRRDPRVSVSLYDHSDPGAYAEIRGTASVQPDPGRALAIGLGEKYEGPGGGAEFAKLPPEVIRVVLRITPTHVAGYLA